MNGFNNDPHGKYERDVEARFNGGQSTSQATGQARTRPLQVDDALVYLEQVRHQFSSNPGVYSTFLEVMKDFKSQALDTHGVIRRVSDLFVEHPALITGFNAFLPFGYEVQVHGNLLRIIEPSGTSESVLNPELEANETAIEADEENDSASNTIDEPLRVDTQHEFQPEENHSLEDALELLNRVHQRYAHEPETYSRFIALLGKYQQSARAEAAGGDEKVHLHNRILRLFKDSPDIIAEFRAFLPSVFVESPGKQPKHKRKTVDELLQFRPPLSTKAQTGATLSERQAIFFEKVSILKKTFRSKETMGAFYHSMELYNRRQLNRADMYTLLTPFFDYSPALMTHLHDLLNDPDDEEGPSRFPLEMRVVEDKAMEIDYLSTRRLGQSYREQAPDKRDAVCSGRKPAHRMVLNDNWMAFASWQSEDSAAVSSKKTPFEEMMWRIEDERFDYDICESILDVSIGILNQIQSKLDAMDERQKRNFKLGDDYGSPTQPTLIPRSVKRVYGEHASKILSALRTSPLESVPCVRKRLELTLEKMKQDKIAHAERWAEQTRACMNRTLEAQAALFRNNDSKFLRCRTIMQDIERNYEERTKLTETLNYDGFLPPLITLNYPQDMSVLFDAHHLIECLFLSQHLAQEEMLNARLMLKFVLPMFLCVNPAKFTDKEEADELSFAQVGRHPLSYTTRLNMQDFAEYVRKHFTDCGRSESQWSQFFGNAVFYGNQNWVFFLRLHSILCDRLSRVKELCRQKRAEFEHEQILERRAREQQQKLGFQRNGAKLNGVDRPKNPKPAPLVEFGNPLQFYDDTLDRIRMLVEQQLEQTAYEDVMRTMFGAEALPLFTMDKLLSILSKYLVAILQDPSTVLLLNLFQEHKRRSLLAPEKQENADVIYEFMCSSVLTDSVCVRSTTVTAGGSPMVAFEMVDAPSIAEWYDAYTKAEMEKARKFDAKSTIELTFLDEARAIRPRRSAHSFLMRNVRKGARRMRMHRLLGDAIVVDEPEESRESTPSEEDDEEAENESPSRPTVPEPMETSETVESATQQPPINRLEPRVPLVEDRATTSFFVCDGIFSYALNTSFGFITSHVGRFGLLLRRGAPYIDRKKAEEQRAKRKQRFADLLES